MRRGNMRGSIIIGLFATFILAACRCEDAHRVR
jgi:hypothetical protein